MPRSSPKSLPLGLPSLALWLACLVGPVGCLESTVSQVCEEMAEKQCSKCFSCSLERESLSGAALCDLPPGETATGCVELMISQCESQSSSLQGANDSLDACSEALDDQLDCALLYEGAVQDHPHTVNACKLFL